MLPASMVYKHYGILGDIQDVECSISGPRSLPCNPCQELANLEKFIAKLERKRYELKRDKNRTHSPFIRMIPPEIIAKISGFTSTDFTIIRSLPAPILLSSICSDWRQTVVGTPQLWSSITIDLPSSNMARSMFLRLATFIDEWLARSGQLPLHIALSSGHETPDPRTLEKYRPILKILDRYSSRWHSLKISIPPCLLSCLQPHHLPLLEQLHIGSSRRDSGYIVTFPPSPRLNTVVIQSSMDSPLPLLSDMGIQWGTVTHVSAEFLTIHNCFEYLRLNPQLVHCKFHNMIRDTLPESPILSPALTYLSLSCFRRSPSNFLDKAVLPSLETLVLFNVSSVNPLMAFLERSACSLHTLSVQNWNIHNTDSLTRLLQFLSPSLTKLVISRSPKGSNEEYLSILTKTYSSQNAVAGNDFLAYLKFFEYREVPQGPFLLEYFELQSLPTRNSTKLVTRPIPLCSASIDLYTKHRPISQDILSILQQLEADGILNMFYLMRPCSNFMEDIRGLESRIPRF